MDTPRQIVSKLQAAGPDTWGWPLGIALTVMFLAGPSRAACLMACAWLVHAAWLTRMTAPVESTSDGGAQPVPTPRWRARALIVDDHPVNLVLVRDLLRRQEVLAVTASNGPEALEIARRESFDIVFLDVQMPEMDGMQVCQALRALHGAHCPPVIALTAHAFPHERKRFLDAGMDECLVKPVNSCHLAHCLDHWLQTGERTAASLPGPAEGPAAIDREACVRLAGGRPELARELVTGLVETLPASLAAIHAAALDGDLHHLRAELHRLLGACRYAGVPGLLEETSRLHRHCARGALPAAGAAAPLHHEGLRVLREAYAWLGVPPASSMITNASA